MLMGRPKKKLADESVKIRFKTLADGRRSIYLDCCDNSKRTYDFLKLYLLPETDAESKRHNKATMKKAEAIQREHTLQLLGVRTNSVSNKPALHSDMLLTEWMDYYIKDLKRSGKKNLHISVVVGKMLAAMASEVRMSQVDVDFCLSYMDYLRNTYRSKTGEPISQMTAWAYQGRFRSALNAAVRAGVLKQNPMRKIDASDKIAMPESKREYLTIDEVKRLIDTPCYKEVIKQSYLFCCFCGLRYGDMANLKWRNLYCNDGQWYVSLVTGKTDEPLVLPLSSKAMEWLPERELAGPDDFVFMDLPNRSMANMLLKSWIWSAGIHKKICFHTSRHTFATMLLTLGADLFVVCKLLGHRGVRSTQIYAKIIDKKKDDAVNSLDAVFLNNTLN